MNRRAVMLGSLATGVAIADAGAQTQMVDPRSILFSMPTIANDAPPVTSLGRAPASSDLLLHEDEWRQIEFFDSARSGEIQQKLQELKAFEAAHQVRSGWTRIYVRDLSPSPVIRGRDSVASIATLLGASRGPAPIIFHGASSIVGALRDGFSLPLGPGAALYGNSDATGISVLCASMQGADDQLLTRAFSLLNRSNGLVVVDWRAQMLLLSVAQDGRIAAWAP